MWLVSPSGGDDQAGRRVSAVLGGVAGVMEGRSEGKRDGKKECVLGCQGEKKDGKGLRKGRDG